jgi:hypothetical protein
VQNDFPDRLRRALGPLPADLAEAAGALAADDAARSSLTGATPALSPWAAWTLVALIRYLPRQRWAGALVLGGTLAPETDGVVPGFPGWLYSRPDEDACQLTCVATDETIDLELHDGSFAYIEPVSWMHNLGAVKHRDPPEARLCALHPAPERIVPAFVELQAAGALVRHPRRYVYRVTEGAEACDADVRAFAARWEDAPSSARAWLAAVLGDWILAAELCPGDAGLRRAAERCLAERVRRLESQLDDPLVGSYALEALIEVAPPERLRRYLIAAIEGAPDRLTRRAAQMIVDDEASDCTREMKDLYDRLSPERDADLVVLTAGYLLARGTAPAEVFPTLLQATHVGRAAPGPTGRGPYVLEAALLALEHTPAEALPLVRRALGSSSPTVRTTMAWVLLVLGGAWAERELLSALRDATDAKTSAPFRVALRRSGGPEALAEVDRWEAAHESERERPWREITAGAFEVNAEQLGERVERIRRALPADFRR